MIDWLDDWSIGCLDSWDGSMIFLQQGNKDDWEHKLEQLVLLAQVYPSVLYHRSRNIFIVSWETTVYPQFGNILRF